LKISQSILRTARRTLETCRKKSANSQNTKTFRISTIFRCLQIQTFLEKGQKWAFDFFLFFKMFFRLKVEI